MIQLYNSCRNVKSNLKLFDRCQKCSRQIWLEKQKRCGKNDNDRKSVPGNKKPNNSSGSKKKNSEGKEYPEAPTTCCMSGCANCVWLEYAEKLSEYYKDGGEQAVKEINERVTDENIKAFLMHELRMRNKKT